MMSAIDRGHTRSASLAGEARFIAIKLQRFEREGFDLTLSHPGSRHLIDTVRP
jgi:hypothetical protein